MLLPRAAALLLVSASGALMVMLLRPLLVAVAVRGERGASLVGASCWVPDVILYLHLTTVLILFGSATWASSGTLLASINGGSALQLHLPITFLGCPTFLPNFWMHN